MKNVQVAQVVPDPIVEDGELRRAEARAEEAGQTSLSACKASWQCWMSTGPVHVASAKKKWKTTAIFRLASTCALYDHLIIKRFK